MQVLDALDEAARQGKPGQLLIRDVMTANPDCISADTTALELVDLFHTREFRHPLVTDDAGRLVGVISDRDVLRCFGPEKHPKLEILAGIRADDIMSTELVTVCPDSPLEHAVNMMLDFGISCLPVVSKERLVGILTSTDIYIVSHLLLQSLPTVLSAQHAPLAAAAR
jgi:acetoin utilization protein AcuB